MDKGHLTLVCGPGENSALDRGSGRSHRRVRKGGRGPGHSASADRGAQQTLADSDVSKGDKGASDHQAWGSLPARDGVESAKLLLCAGGRGGFSQASSCALSEGQEDAHSCPQGGPKARIQMSLEWD